MNTSKIKLLTEDVIGKIAAGEVVERPASCVKELVENSIDAGSTSIVVDIESAGESFIRIADNGSGMTEEDLLVACRRHSTSKIKDAKDLDNINTLGFRGEALASIAAVAHMDIITKTEDAATGIYAYLESGEILKTRPAARPTGTTVEVRNLFYNVPARRKFLKRESTELAEIVNVVGRFILSYPEIEFKLTQGDRLLLHATKNMDALERIRLVLGADVSEHMLEIFFSRGSYKITGFVSLPSFTRKDKRAQIFFVNGRYFRNRFLNYALYDAYKSMLERGRFPSCVLFLEVPPSEIDVNVHPSKMEVKFSDEVRMKSLLEEAITEKFNEIKKKQEEKKEEFTKKSSDKKEPNESIFDDTPGVQTEFAYNVEENAHVSKGVLTGASGIYSPWKDSNTHVHDLFQLGECYIVEVKAGGIMVTDQHAAHERILYEFFSSGLEMGSLEKQNLLFPARVDLSPNEAILMEKMIDSFKKIGFDIESFGKNSYVVQAVPAVLKDSDVKTVIYDILSDLQKENLSKIDVLDELAKLTACRAAIKAGDTLNSKEMTSLIAKLATCKLPFTCPHGRPTRFEITVDELEKRFRRT